jgi:hypothetical protein
VVCIALREAGHIADVFCYLQNANPSDSTVIITSHSHTNNACALYSYRQIFIPMFTQDHPSAAAGNSFAGVQ